MNISVDSIHVNDSSALNPSPTASASGSNSSAHHLGLTGESGGAGGAAGKQRRAFKACAHCRQRKAKCELGDIDNPRDPPCTRCRREGVECTFLPSRRGGRVPFNNQRKNQDGEDAKPRKTTVKREHSPEVLPPEESLASTPQLSYPHNPINAHLLLASLPTGSSSASSTSSSNPFNLISPPSTTHYPPVPAVPPPPLSAADIFRPPRTSGASAMVVSPTGRNPDSDASPADYSSVSDAGSHQGGILNLGGSQTTTALSATSSNPIQQPSHTRKKRRRNSGPVDPETLASAPMRNPVDALDLLVLAADGGVREEGDMDGGMDESAEGEDEEESGSGRRRGGIGVGSQEVDSENSRRNGMGHGTGGKGKGTSKRGGEEASPASLEDFPLVKSGVVTPQKVSELVELFFSHIHFIFPIIPSARVPKTESELAVFAREELYLTTVIIVISSRHDKDPEVHDKSWAYLQTLISGLILGKPASVGAVEAMLLLSEYLPRQQDLAPAQINAEENRMSWMLVGCAVRLGYMLRLDEKSLLPAKSLDESTDNSVAQELLNRERVAWTYCYLFDRQISIRTGKAFWSRGPALCFTVPNAAKNFPSLRFIPDKQDDFASLLQAYIELSQIMTSTNDILYPSRERTLSLVRLGEYYKYLDQFLRSLEAFKMTWEGKRWETYPLTECVWITFHYLRLYIYGFAFQAQIQRATWDQTSGEDTRTRGSPSTGISFFPAGLVASPDAKFILEAIDAAADLLRLVTDRLHPGGALPFLPWRFFMMFSYAGVFLLKAVYVEAVAALDRTVIILLLKRLIFVLACASTDEQHPGVRYARLLNGLLRAFSQGHESMSITRAATPARRNSVAPETAPTGQSVPMATNNSGSGNGRPDVDFTLSWAGLNGNGSSAHPSPATQLQALYQPQHPQNPDFHPYAATSPFHPPSGFDLTRDMALGSMSLAQSRSTSVSVHASNSGVPQSAFPMLPFSESQPFHQLASTLEDVDFAEFGFEAEALPEPSEAFNFLLQDDGLDVLWGSFDATGGDWINPGGSNGAGYGL